MFLRNALRRVLFFVIGTLMCGFHGENLNPMVRVLSVRAWKLPFAVEFNPSAGEEGPRSDSSQENSGSYSSVSGLFCIINKSVLLPLTGKRRLVF